MEAENERIIKRRVRRSKSQIEADEAAGIKMKWKRKDAGSVSKETKEPREPKKTRQPKEPKEPKEKKPSRRKSKAQTIDEKDDIDLDLDVVFDDADDDDDDDQDKNHDQVC